MMTDLIIYKYIHIYPHTHTYTSTELPRWLRGEGSARQCRRHVFDPLVGINPWRRKWQPLQYFCLWNTMDRGAWWATVHVVTKESDTT